MKRIIIKLIPDIFWDLYRRYNYKKGQSKNSKAEGVADTFSKIYESNFWQSSESFSGTGSDLKQTEVIRNDIPEVIKKYEIRTMLDVPCGDFNWMKLIDLNGTFYTGGDIVPDMIESNNAKYANQQIKFEQINLLGGTLPTTDLIFCRDCLVHFSYEHISQAIRNIKASNSKFFLTTSFIKRRLNFDITTGDWRPINLQIKPFNFGKPLEVIIEKCTEGNGKSYDKSLLLYRVSDLPDNFSFEK